MFGNLSLFTSLTRSWECILHAALSLSLLSCLHALNFPFSFLFASQLTKATNWSIKFSPTSCVFQALKPRQWLVNCSSYLSCHFLCYGFILNRQSTLYIIKQKHVWKLHLLHRRFLIFHLLQILAAYILPHIEGRCTCTQHPSAIFLFLIVFRVAFILLLPPCPLSYSYLLQQATSPFDFEICYWWQDGGSS